MRSEVSASVLLTIAVSLLTLGVSFLKEGVVAEGCVCIVVGFGLIICVIVLLEKGVIEKVKGLTCAPEDAEQSDESNPNPLTGELAEVWNKVHCVDKRVVKLETHISWLKEKAKALDERQWTILATVIIGILITILAKVM